MYRIQCDTVSKHSEHNKAAHIPSTAQAGDVEVTDTPHVVVSTVAANGVPAGERMVTIPGVAEKINVVVTKVFDMLNNHQLLAVRIDGVRYIPEVFLKNGKDVNKFVPGVIALLSDGGYSPEEIMEYLFTEDDSLPGRPVDALQGHLAREVMRRAQAMGL